MFIISYSSSYTFLQQYTLNNLDASQSPVKGHLMVDTGILYTLKSIPIENTFLEISTKLINLALFAKAK